MGKRGPLPDKAKAAELLRIDDHPQADASDDGGLPIVPRDLDMFAQEMWDVMYPALQKQGLVKLTDSHQLRAMCEWWSEYRQAAEGESRTGVLLAQVASSIHRLAEHIEPARCAGDVHAVACRIEDAIAEFAEGSKHRLDCMAKAFKNFNDISAKFGMTPADRLRMSDVKPTQRKKTRIEELMELRRSKLG